MRRTDDFNLSVACRRCPTEIHTSWHARVKVIAARLERDGWTFRDDRGWFCDDCSARRRA